MSEPIVQIKNVSKKIGKKLIIDNLSLEIYSGEVFGFLGPNGAGKTTTIRMLLGLASITNGEITISSVLFSFQRCNIFHLYKKRYYNLKK